MNAMARITLTDNRVSVPLAYDGRKKESIALAQTVCTLKTLGAPRGFTPWVYMGDVTAGKIKLQELDSLEAVIKSAQAKRVDAGYSNIDVAAYYMKNKMGNATILVFDESLPHDKSTYHLSTLKHANIINEFNEFQKHEKALIDKLKAQYGVK